ncbi:type II toxin-antitoxin system VapB family antitoxin [Agrobacterium rubi]|uniref:Type II toxin-antitoxin system VapB family antitoxin n=1 Tax=Agrobacterium rubi TaxID=28099 RepID=A0AAE7R368_9HYPH|nr:type II toxin-antitoxin system VapB family antitoxin [Agrobacterium rubi]NTE85861.1 type II toxin-antitoxin system VapB family antitoxin [Agrobacterium rubi]NTF01793.1 type II toxin-antitoxin system VapB family antitoxin [Agrobacterium rubi]NTF36036.1 type II toxin-antitoxin system VapB family antitoxin [Agrobacterium rubi]OCJ53163.1 transcriptional regulator [Agrobacterium rubi]QTG01125.1 type II toxin-antitoxin system VapB family antitoxin [Agrobacterium rubi]
MRTTIEIDDALIAEAMELSGLPTKEAVVELAVREFIEYHSRRKALDELKGMGWDGDLDEMRSGGDSKTTHNQHAAE